MSENFLQIQKEYLRQAWLRPLEQMETAIPAERRAHCFLFRAFGEPCELYPQEIILGGQELTGAEGILISLYALHVQKEEPQLHPLKSFKQFPGGPAYSGAFSAHAEKSLCPYVPILQQRQEEFATRFSGHINSDPPIGDFSFTLFALPRLPLYYTFYLPSEEFPASVTCLFASNATRFMPVDGLADMAEYTARKMIEIITGIKS
jgi:hypothetical protein